MLQRVGHHRTDRTGQSHRVLFEQHRLLARDQGRVQFGVGKGMAAHHVTQELQTESSTLRGTLDEARHVRNGVAHLSGLNNAEVGVKGSERVISNLWSGCRNRSN